MFVICRKNNFGKLAAKPDFPHSYTHNIKFAYLYQTKEDAEKYLMYNECARELNNSEVIQIEQLGGNPLEKRR